MSKVWLVTGSANGLGRSIAEAVLNSGASLVATARNIKSMDDLKERFGNRVLLVTLDVTDPVAAKNAIEQAVDTFGRLDVLVNNAGFGRISPFEQTSEDDFLAQMDTNFFGVVNLIRAALPLMREQRSGHIINVSSVGGRIGNPGLSAYQSAKWAVGGLTEALAQEIAPFGIKVIAVEPGGMRTNWGIAAVKDTPPLLVDYEPTVGTLTKMLNGYVGHEVGDPEKIAKVIVDLAKRDILPAHLLLGSDALHVFNEAEAHRIKAAAEWEAVSRSTDFDGSNLDLLTGNQTV
ncbi:SDR family NAD(P)-dependent oxidoreductase [Phyllobacterium myrsinacearum]|uniref:NAD(P)-dependent dehydrogenase (Short-subunit alcohol dehydrogenase family) n=1 Tax=Phyllobacterium myrsinacearum TaxID=28101 RepID=A0A839ETK5_9HYPH|nr:SDR family NAD(P)-dependent oxidoreductase [Phyllobacterium myrsinacearum]MBA8879757.1 NAD(P)-dependent dehydrogenase (short-subunit alcohol dehydrogenase family) [Phyllobacterium myrsinacearum]